MLKSRSSGSARSVQPELNGLFLASAQLTPIRVPVNAG
ncbi:Uncharacterised protein [Mycobacteroides abscessus subsp. abscessus]|nr:Uncharacterised protein [Mycobacteroides abscessus subsp. abscessus]